MIDRERGGLRGLNSWTTLTGVVSVVAAAVLLSSCQKSSGAGQAKGGPRTVLVASGVVERKAIPVELKTFGTVEPFSSVGIKSEVTGTLLRVHIRRGQEVKKGDLLFETDPRTYEAAVAQADSAVAQSRAAVKQAQATVKQAQAAVKQAQGTLLHDQVQEANARKTVARQAEMLKKSVAAQADYDKALADADALAAAVQADEAVVQADEAAVEAAEAAVHAGEETVRTNQAILQNAKLQLEHCAIRSPIGGKAGNLLVDEGNLVKADDTTLVTINQIQPIEVFFSIAQKDLEAVRKYMAEGALAVKAAPAEGEGKEEVGELTFVDNVIDKASGTLQVAATFENGNKRLWPGQYVHVTLELTVEKDALVVPTEAVQTGRDGKYVYVIRANHTVEMRAVTVGEIFGAVTTIQGGLSAGDPVVTDGQFQLEDGSKVEVQPSESAGTKSGGEKPDEKKAGL